jgi:hypothetical protein
MGWLRSPNETVPAKHLATWLWTVKNLDLVPTVLESVDVVTRRWEEKLPAIGSHPDTRTLGFPSIIY